MDAEIYKSIAQVGQYIGVGMCALSMLGAALGVARIWVAIIETIGRNPSVKSDVSIYGWVGFAVTEAIALYAMVLALLTLFN